MAPRPETGNRLLQDEEDSPHRPVLLSALPPLLKRDPYLDRPGTNRRRRVPDVAGSASDNAAKNSEKALLGHAPGL